MTNQAIEKLKKELADIKGSSQIINIIKKPVADTLSGFCKQDEEFAQAIVQSKKSLGDCLSEIVKGVTTGISDIETYRKAVQFYFPGAGVHMSMTIDLCASVNDGDDTAAASDNSQITLNFEDFM